MDLIIHSKDDLQGLPNYTYAQRCQIKKVSFYPSKFASDTLMEMLEQLRSLQSIEYVMIEHQEFSFAIVSEIVKWLRFQRELVTLHLSRNQWDRSAILVLAECLASLHSKRCLNLNQSQWTGEEIVQFFQKSDARDWQALSLVNAFICENDSPLSSILELGSSVHTLVLGSTLAHPKYNYDALKCLIQKHHNIMNLQINGMVFEHHHCQTTLSVNQEQKTSLEYLSARMLTGYWASLHTIVSLFPWASLTTLSLSHNPWMAQDFFLHKCPLNQIHWLDLSYCQLSSEHKKHLLDTFYAMPALMGISLQGNPGLYTILPEMILALKKHSLTWLNLSGIFLTETVLKEIAELPFLTTFIAKDCDLSFDKIKIFMQAIAMTSSLTTFYFEQNVLPPAAYIYCQNILQKHNTLLEKTILSYQTSTVHTDYEKKLLIGHLFNNQYAMRSLYPFSLRYKIVERYCPQYKNTIKKLEDYLNIQWDLALDKKMLYHPFFQRSYLTEG